MIININDNNYNKFLDKKDDKYYILDFWSSRCEACRFNAAIVDEVSKEYEGSFIVGKINVDESPYAVAHFSISILPCLVIYYKKKILTKFYGDTSKVTIKNFMNM